MILRRSFVEIRGFSHNYDFVAVVTSDEQVLVRSKELMAWHLLSCFVLVYENKTTMLLYFYQKAFYEKSLPIMQIFR